MTDQIKLKETLGPVMEIKCHNGEVDRVQLVIVEKATDCDEGDSD
jgi:hypothetical protein